MSSSRSLPQNDGSVSAPGDDQFLPWPFALSAIVGGIMGAVAKTLKPRSTNLKLGPVIVGILAGVALGILGAAAYAIGVNLTNYIPQAKAGEGLIFFVSGVISYMSRSPAVLASLLSRTNRSARLSEAKLNEDTSMRIGRLAVAPKLDTLKPLL